MGLVILHDEHDEKSRKIVVDNPTVDFLPAEEWRTKYSVTRFPAVLETERGLVIENVASYSEALTLAAELVVIEGMAFSPSLAVDWLSRESFYRRALLIPDYKLQNASLGIYDSSIIESYRLTCEAFREEFYRLKTLIDGGEKSIAPNWPTEIITGA